VQPVLGYVRLLGCFELILQYCYPFVGELCRPGREQEPVQAKHGKGVGPSCAFMLACLLKLAKMLCGPLVCACRHQVGRQGRRHRRPACISGSCGAGAVCEPGLPPSPGPFRPAGDSHSHTVPGGKHYYCYSTVGHSTYMQQQQSAPGMLYHCSHIFVRRRHSRPGACLAPSPPSGCRASTRSFTTMAGQLAIPRAFKSLCRWASQPRASGSD
jgi:hypothetical protein